MDISLLVWTFSNEGTYKRGDIIDCSPWHNGMCSHPRFVLVNIRNMPDNAEYDAQFKRVKRMFEGAHGVGYEQAVLRRRAWRINFSLMSDAKKNLILRDRRISLEWSEAKDYLCRKDVIDDEDYTRDGNVFLQDGDL